MNFVLDRKEISAMTSTAPRPAPFRRAAAAILSGALLLGARPADAQLKIDTTLLPTGYVNVAYPVTQLQASGGSPPYAWQIIAGTVPAGLAFTTAGAISGTPTSTAAAPLTFQV